ncbi:aspartate dehydrogenase [Parasedimentitalea psychrophila]|uniref:L-aspartate dehydrogenase n=1 Tax=Parasedimentitalea psychrophila TaxID=2997337 RepID=A0A9Y2L095_9RHOB|nr:aspartate dehydrogenase [Parasedimentitalea psychrophila]WIY26321.1 aspartate dehydrogenase [Parasedimentitalea psychrophila]
MIVGIIGNGAIARHVREHIASSNHSLGAVLLRPERRREHGEEHGGDHHVYSVGELPDDLDLMIDCAGHSALSAYGADILRRGTNLITVSIGALADQKLYDKLQDSALQGNAKLHLASGAIGALDCLQAARTGQLASVTYVGRKPPIGWVGSPAEQVLDLEAMTTGAAVHFEGSAREAALAYPKNANVAAAVALAGLGFEKTSVKLIADAAISENIHEIEAIGDFGSFQFQIRGKSLPDNPRSSALAAMSVVSKLEQLTNPIML